MTDQILDPKGDEPIDFLDMRNYRIEKLPKRKKAKLEKWLTYIGPPLAVISFVLLAYILKLPFLLQIDHSTLTEEAKAVFDKIGAESFSRINAIMLGIFVTGLILWITESLPNYLTSLILIVSLVLTGVLPERKAYAELGHPVMWFNIMLFVLASMLVTTGVAKRFALWYIIKFGKNAGTIFLSFMFINIVLSAFISATTAKAAILLPVFMVIAAIYGARGGDHRNNFGRSIYTGSWFCSYRSSFNQRKCFLQSYWNR
ncbi:MAG: SLC13 family permease [Bacteroidales bacterium]|nr:SLC13 family permease [Bacteroidales bacterium]